MYILKTIYMKTKNDILDVDFIGEQAPVTVEEEKTLNDFFRLKKNNKKKKEYSSSNLIL